jgi:redox-sensitive bicupin YhaK (pirin superfamily)
MDVPPHPHTGLQTVSWLFEGEVEHRDSAGVHAMVRPGELNLMTAGAGICHSEVSTVTTTVLHGVQLWVALPGEQRVTTPDWQHETALPVVCDRGLRATVIMGELTGARSPGTAYSPLVGVDLDVAAGADVLVPLEPDFEHAVLVMSGAVHVDGTELAPGAMLYLGCGRRDLRLQADGSSSGARVLLLGGAPFEESIVMWWNFVGRSNEEIVQAREDWAAGTRFGTVLGAGEPLTAPPLPAGRLRPRGRER